MQPFRIPAVLSMVLTGIFVGLGSFTATAAGTPGMVPPLTLALLVAGMTAIGGALGLVGKAALGSGPLINSVTESNTETTTATPTDGGKPIVSVVETVAKTTTVEPSVEDKPKAVDQPKGPSKLFTFLLMFLAGCACWQPASADYSTPKCAIARASVDCGSSAVGAFAVNTLSNLPADTQASVLASLEANGTTAGACIFAAIITNAGSLVSAHPGALKAAPSLTLVSSAETHLARWRAATGTNGVKLCFDGGKSCL